MTHDEFADKIAKEWEASKATVTLVKRPNGALEFVPLSKMQVDNRTAAKDLHDASMRLLALQLERIR